MRILVAEDDELVVEPLIKSLTAQHYTVDVAADGQTAWELIDSFPYDLILLDIELPKLDGISFCRRLRSQRIQVPVLMLTARQDNETKVISLDAGADDYVTKPFNLKELLARIRALLRRGGGVLLPALQWEQLHLDPSTHEVHYRDQPLHLTPKEYGLLELFLRNPQRVFSRSDVIDHLWSFEEMPGEETVTVHIRTLRQKLRAAGVPDEPIETVYGIGYRLKPEEAIVVATAPDRQQDFSDRPPPLPTAAQSLSPEQQVLGALDASWQRSQAVIHQRIALINQAVTALLSDRLMPTLRQQAEQAAHKLAGALGMFELDQGSILAREIEHLLQTPQPLSPSQQRQLVERVTALTALLEQTPPQVVPAALPRRSWQNRARPLLWLVGQYEASTLAAIVQMAHQRDLQTQVVPNVSTAHTQISAERPDVVLLMLIPAQADPTEGRLCPESRALLGELRAYTPPIPVLGMIPPEASIDRVQVARLGGRGLLRSSEAAVEVVEAIVQVLQRSRPVAARVMAVDDDPTVLEILRYWLKPWGLEVVTLDHPQQFWQVLEATTPDLLILDVEMPDINGLELCQTVRNDRRWIDLPILFLTAHTDADTKRKVFEVGADDYLSKPIVVPELVTRVLNRLERTRLRLSLSQTDMLTGVLNRRHATQLLQDLLQLCDRRRQPFCLAVLTVEGLKQLNQQQGYAAGDQVLASVGKQLRQHFQGEDVVGRWGGTTFVIGLYGLTPAEGERRLADEISSPLKSVAETAAVWLTMGMAAYPQGGITLAQLYQTATTHAQAEADPPLPAITPTSTAATDKGRSRSVRRRRS
ncbi:MAG: response regulator [Almyronema sp.]